MLRMAHLLLNTPKQHCSPFSASERRTSSHYDSVVGRLASGEMPVVCADDVADFAMSKDTLTAHDLVGLSMPFENMFVEWSYWMHDGSRSMFGMAMERVDRESSAFDILLESCRSKLGTIAGFSHDQCSHAVVMIPFGLGTVPSLAFHAPLQATAFIDVRGNFMFHAFSVDFEVDSEARTYAEQMCNDMRIESAIALLSLSFMGCSNVVTRDATKEVGPSAKWLRRQKQPEIRYHVLDINPMKQVLRTEGNIEANGLKKAMHICRGHFATYSEERPLFGKYSGRFWVPAHVKGSPEHGIVDKDYRIRLPGVSQ